MADGVARVVVEADTSLADAAFKKLQADAARAMDSIGRQHAEAEVGAKTTDFDRKIDNVKKDIAKLDGTTANPNVDINSAEAQAELAKLRLELKKLSGERATIRVDAKELRDANKLRDISAKKQAAMSKLYLDEQKAIQRTAKTREQAAASEERSIRQQALLHERAFREDFQRTEKLAKARRDYGKVLGDLQRLETKTGRPGGIFRTGGETRELDVARTKAEALAREVEHLGGTISDINPDLERNQGLFGRWASSVSKTRVQLGFFSTTIAQAGKGLIGLGPILTGLGGGLISVIGVLGSGIAGATAVGAAGLAGFIGAAIGTVAIVKPMVKQFQEAHKASENLAKAQKEYGKGSTQAKTAQEKFNHVMAGTSPAAKAAVKDYGKITGQWKTLTAAAKPAVFDAFGQGIRTVQALLPGFAKQSVATTKTAAHAWDGWMTSLRSPEAKQLLNTVLSNFRASIPGVADGLASLSAAFGRIAASASKSLPSLTKGFSNWANDIEASVGGGDALDKKIQSMVHNMQDLGHLTQDTGSLLMHIFGASSKSGDHLVDSLDKVINRWDTWTQSAQGQDSLQNFFGEARQETEQFFSALAPLTRLLFQMSRAFAPITSGALVAVRYVGDIVETLSKLPGLKGGLEALGGILAGVWAVGKVRAFAGAVGDAAGALRAMFAAEGASGGLATLLGAGGGASRGLGNVAKDAREVGVATSTVEANAAAGAASAGLFTDALAVLVPGAALGGLVVLANNFDQTNEAFEDAVAAFKKGETAIPHSLAEISKASDNYNKSLNKGRSISEETVTAQKHVAKLRKESAPEAKVMKAIQHWNDLERENAAVQRQAGQQAGRTVKETKDLLSNAEAQVKRARAAKAAGVSERENATSRTGAGVSKYLEQLEAQKKITAATRLEQSALKQATAAKRELAVANIPFVRQAEHLVPLTAETVTGLKKLSATIGSTAAAKVGKFVDPKDVHQITQLGNKLTALGRGGQVKNIAVKSQGADQTIAKLSRLQKQTQRVEGARATVKVNANDSEAQGKLKRVSALAQRLIGVNPTVKILADASNAQNAINKLRSKLQALASEKHEAQLSAINKTGPAASIAKRNLAQTANGKYEADLKAIDKTIAGTAPAKSRLQNVANGHYEAHITANAGQALSTISSVQSALSSLHDKTVNVNVVKHGSGAYSGGPSVYAYTGTNSRAFALGGVPSDKELLRAAEKAEKRRGGTGGVIRKPTMLVGEQAPSYNEFVITENPAFRSNNEKYLEQAAAGLGMGVASYASGGKSNGNKKGKKGNPTEAPHAGGAQTAISPPPPHLPAHVSKYRSPTEVNSGRPIQGYNEAERNIAAKEGKYNAELGKEEQEIEIYKKTGKGRSQWSFSFFKALRKEILGDERQVENKWIPGMIKHVTGVKNHAQGVFDATKRREGQVGSRKRDDEKRLREQEDHYKHMERNKNESQKDFNNKKLTTKKAIEATKKQVEKWEKYETELEERKKEANQTVHDAEQEIASIKQEDIPNNRNAMTETETALSGLEAIESGQLEAPYAEPSEPEEKEKPIERAEAQVIEAELLGPGGAATLTAARENLLQVAEGELAAARQTPQAADDIEALNEVKSAKEALTEAGGNTQTRGEETATLNGARQSLYEQFASNITDGAPTPSLAGFSPDAQNFINSLASRTNGGGFGTAGGPTPVGQGALDSSLSGSGTGTINHVTSYFSTPPPDPHTFSKNLIFELGAL